MKYSKFTFRRLLLSSLLVISVPLAANAEPQPGASSEHNDTQPFSNEGHMRHHFKHGGNTFHFPPEINLTESQRDQIFSIKHKQEALFYDQSKIVRKAHIDLRQLVTSDQYDDDKAKAIAEKLGKAIGNIKFLQVQTKHQIYALLTPEQRDLIKAHKFNRTSENTKQP